MEISPGTNLGPYEILALIGKGGMGEVWKARDTRLNRLVAIKVSARTFTERFQREALAIASLNHPNICTLYDVGPDYLVLELVEGEEIKGQRPVGEALRLAIQIADAISHAHRHGLIHRDLKPANILVTRSGVKVLDFGLSKLIRAQASPEPPEDALAATVTETALTQPGTILGTPRYMAPEQIEGKEADQRSDVFAFGLVLYELLAGCPAFEGESQASLIAAILTAQPKPVTSFQPLTPPALVHLIDTCLAKDPGERRQTMHDVLLELRWIAAGGSQQGLPEPAAKPHGLKQVLPWTLAAAGLLSAAVLGFLHFSENTAPAGVVRFEHTVPPRRNAQNWWDIPAVSPDGLSVAYTGVAPGKGTMLWLRRLDAVQAALLAGTEGAEQPFWSPDSRYIAYFASGKLWKIDTNGGPPQVLADVPGPFGGTWSREGVIVLGVQRGPLQQASSSGGRLTPLLTLDASRQESHQYWPHFLPDGRHFLYASYSSGTQTGTWVGSLDGAPPRRILENTANVNFVRPGLLLFGRGPILVAQAFDPEKLHLAGEPVPVVDRLIRAPFSLGLNFHSYSSSPGGTLVYRTESGEADTRQLTWWSRSGKRLEPVGEPRRYIQGTLSPDEKRFALQVGDPAGGPSAIWIMDLSSGILSRATTDPAHKNTVLWSPDGRELLFTSAMDRGTHLHRMAIGGSDERLVPATGEAAYPSAWLRDNSIVFQNTHGRTFYRLPAGQGAKVESLLETDYDKDGLQISPDGRWAAYNTRESGTWEVYVAAFPSFAQKRQVSNNSGAQARWRKDGNELFYLSLDGNLMSVPIKTSPVLEAGAPTILFSTRVLVDPKQDQYAVTGDGQRFLLLEPLDSEVNTLTVVLNWPAAAKPLSTRR